MLQTIDVNNASVAEVIRERMASATATIKGLMPSLYTDLTQSYDGDINIIDSSGSYRLFAPCTNVPSGFTVAGSVLNHYRWDINAAYQTIYPRGADFILYRRKNAGTWLQWRKIDPPLY